jgi:hypothetical protein
MNPTLRISEGARGDSNGGREQLIEGDQNEEGEDEKEHCIKENQNKGSQKAQTAIKALWISSQTYSDGRS